jgi:hypothetical protein
MAYAVGQTNIHVEADGLKAHLDMYGRVMRMSVEQVLKQQARLVCQDVLSLELPYIDPGGGERGIRNDALEKGENSLKADLKRIFRPLGKASWEDIAQKGDYGVFNAWIADANKVGRDVPSWLQNQSVVGVGEWDRFQSLYSKNESPYGKFAGVVDFSAANAGEGQIKTIHTKARGGDRVRNYKRNIKLYSRDKTHFVSDLDAKLTAYSRRVEKRIGTLKGGFYDAGSKLGRIRANAWIKDNSAGNGILDTNNLKFDSEKSITVGNKSHYYMTIPPGSDRWRLIYSIRAKKMRDSMAMALTRRSKGDLQTLEKLIKETKSDAFLIQGRDDPF